MGFKSEAQRRKFQQLVNEGKITQEKYDEWEGKTPTKLPARNPSYQPKIRKPKYIRGPK